MEVFISIPIESNQAWNYKVVLVRVQHYSILLIVLSSANDDKGTKTCFIQWNDFKETFTALATKFWCTIFSVLGLYHYSTIIYKYYHNHYKISLSSCNYIFIVKKIYDIFLRLVLSYIPAVSESIICAIPNIQ